MDVFNEIKAPVLGLITSAGSVIVSMQNITAICQLIAAVIAVFVGFGTLRLTYLKIKRISKNKSDDE